MKHAVEISLFYSLKTSMWHLYKCISNRLKDSAHQNKGKTIHIIDIKQGAIQMELKTRKRKCYCRSSTALSKHTEPISKSYNNNKNVQIRASSEENTENGKIISKQMTELTSIDVFSRNRMSRFNDKNQRYLL